MRYFIIAALALFVAPISAEEIPPSKFTQAGHTTDSLKTMKERLDDGKAVLIDVRELAEWNEGHLVDADLVPLSAIRANELTKEMKESLPKDKPIYCH